ncbi:hybrid sensor histidine kinase/response regulator [Cerasicoccus maritimus]|uniref:hybrid sensor histidine kinase/response regulator n=1 Tax=Cerasicoccus maritimus TaxID=490089 RepID=UPI002852BDD1|nr:hybrid sensor histidine kinase/response regulator [Cerasicoccus maritimus]
MKLFENDNATVKPVVLAVDDQPENLRLIGNTLANSSFSLAFALSAEDALSWLKDNEPDIILMDVSMPGMNGLDCCRFLKTQEKYADLPIIFLTAHVEEDDVEDGFNAGAVDYIGKPFRPSELIARVRTHLKLRDAQRRLEKQLQLKSELIGIIAHDVRGPIASIRGFSEIISDELHAAESYNAIEDLDEMIQAISYSAEKTLNTLNELLNLKFTSSGNLEATVTDVSLLDVIEDVRLRNIGQAERKTITLHFQGELDQIIAADPFLLSEVLDNLISNGLKYSPPGKSVYVEGAKDTEGRPCIVVYDEGPGFQEEDYDKLFQGYQRLSARPTGGESSFGLGLSIVKKLMIAQGGDVSLVSKPGESARFLITLHN